MDFTLARWFFLNFMVLATCRGNAGNESALKTEIKCRKGESLQPIFKRDKLLKPSHLFSLRHWTGVSKLHLCATCEVAEQKRITSGKKKLSQMTVGLK